MYTHETRASQTRLVSGNSPRQGNVQLKKSLPKAAAQSHVQQAIDSSARVQQLKASRQLLAAQAVQRVAQRNIAPGSAAQHNWDAKHVPQRVKDWATSAEATVKNQYETTLRTLSSNPLNNGDGMLAYLNGWNHKRFGGHFCLLYSWAPRRDGNGFYLCVKGIGRKNGNGQQYALAD